jgi:uncharacterized Zn finger protein
VAAVHYILGEQFDEDPFLLFRLRGRSQEQLMADLRARRAGETGEDFDEAEAEEPAVPLTDALADFWGAAHPLETVQTTVKPSSINLPLLKRLGQPLFLSDDNLVKLLGPAYQAIAGQAVAASETVAGAEELG